MSPVMYVIGANFTALLSLSSNLFQPIKMRVVKVVFPTAEPAVNASNNIANGDVNTSLPSNDYTTNRRRATFLRMRTRHSTIQPEPSRTRELRVYWPAPMMQDPVVRTYLQPRRTRNFGVDDGVTQTMESMDGYDEPYLMRVTKINLPGTVAYSFASNVRRVYSVIAHYRDEHKYAHIDTYMDANMPKCTWVYVPLAPGEVVLDIVVLTGRWTVVNPMRAPDSGLAVSGLVCFLLLLPSYYYAGHCLPTAKTKQFVTNYRKLTFGAFWAASLRNATMQSLVTPRGQPTYFAMNRSDLYRDGGDPRGMSVMAFNGSFLPAADSTPPVNTGPDQNANNGVNLPTNLPTDIDLDQKHRQFPLANDAPLPSRSCFFSCGSLEDVVAIQVCTNPCLAHRPVVGLRLSYSKESGRLDAYLGSWRLDWLHAKGNPREMRVPSGSPGLYVCYKRFAFVPRESASKPGLSAPYQNTFFISAISTDVQEEGDGPSPSVTFDDPERDYVASWKWYRVPWQGILEWFFSSELRGLYHNGSDVLQYFGAFTRTQNKELDIPGRIWEGQRST